MALTLHQSNRIEYLADALALLAAVPPREVLAAEEVLVAAPGMRRFVDMSLAQRWGVAANIRYDHVPAFFWRVMFACLPTMPSENVYAPPVLRWRIFAALVDGSVPEVQAALGSYLSAYDTAAYELAQTVAQLFDQYLVYRAQWTEVWTRDQLNDLGADEVWQATLWRHVRAKIDTPHRVALWQELHAFLQQDTLPSTVRLPERVFVFGASTLAPVYLRLLEALSRHCDVHLLALNPCAEYWADARSPAQQLHDGDLTVVAGHPLLVSWGKQGRDFFDMLSELHPVGGHLLFPAAPKCPTLLQRLQDDIQAARSPCAGAEADDSIILVSAYSPLRELQAVKDAVLDFLGAHPECSPDDVAILSPSIEQYTPFIEAIFGRTAPDGVALPYSIADTKISCGEPFLQAWEILLALFSSRFEVSALLPLVDNECVLRRFDLTRDDVPLLQHLLRETGVHWGWDEAERARAGGAGTVFTWTQALNRLSAGVLLPAENILWQGVAPFATEIELLPVLSSCMDLLETLAAARDLWQAAATPEEWVRRIADIGAMLLDTADSHAATVFAAQMSAWKNECTHADFAARLDAATVTEHLRCYLSAPAEAGFMRGGVTFGSLIPLRNLPFSCLALIGMNDDAFPRADQHPPFDLMAVHPRKGDRARRDDDRYLFLESVMSAREVLYLSYVGRDIRDNEAHAPSELICELGDVLAVMTDTQGDYWASHLRQHPLQAFSPRYFGEGMRSYRADYAAALNAPREAVRPFFVADENAEFVLPPSIDWSDFLYFWRNPPRAWLQRTLSWKNTYREQTQDDGEPFAVIDEAAVNLAYMDARQTHEDFDAVDALLSAQSRYPAARLGEMECDTYRRAVAAMDETLFSARLFPPQPFTLILRDTVLTGSLSHLRENGQIFLRGKLSSAPQQISDYLTHLIACAVYPEPPVTVIAAPRATVRLFPIAAEEARARLQTWCDAYAIGQSRPLPFFARTSLAVAQAWHQRKDVDAAAHNAWFTQDKKLGQSEYIEVKTAFARDEVLPIDTPLFRDLIETLLLPMMVLLSEAGEDNA